jgi:hypothetical protein
MEKEFWIGSHIIKVQNNFFSSIILKKYGSSFTLKNVEDELYFFDLVVEKKCGFYSNTVLFFIKISKENMHCCFINLSNMKDFLTNLDFMFEINTGLLKKVTAKYRLNQK